MPIDADGVMIDGKHERLPKQLSLYQLPSNKDRKLRKLLENALFEVRDSRSKQTRDFNREI